MLLHHLFHALRRLKRRPLQTAVIVLTFGLALGAVSAIFSLVNAVLIRPLPFADPDRLVIVWTEFTQQGRLEGRLSEPEVLDLRRSNILERLAVFADTRVNLTGLGEPEQIEIALTTSDLLPVLGLQPILGRNFLPEEDQPGAPGVVLLSHGFWVRHFGSDPSVIERRLFLDGQPYTIVGVLPSNIQILEDVQLWAPLGLDVINPNSRGLHYLDGIGLLPQKKGLPQASAELATLATRLQQSFLEFYPEGSGWRLRAEPLMEEQTAEIRPALLLLFGASTLVLLIACVNVANLWLGDVWGRRKDFAVQVALGASRSQIFGQLVLQGLMLGVLGGCLGILLAQWAVRLFLTLVPATSPRLREVTFDLNVFAFALGLSLLVGMVTSVVPALKVSDGVSQTLQEMVGRASQSVRSRQLRGLLVTTEIAIGLIVVVGAGLLLKNLSTLYQEPPGFQSEGLLTFSLALSSKEYSTDPGIVGFYNELIRQVRGLPGVESASTVSHLPLSGRKYSGDFSVEGLSDGGASAGFEALRLAVGPRYFETMGIPVLQGRSFSDQDHATALGVVIIDEVLARRFWPQGDAVGKRLKRGRPGSEEPWLTVVGVVRQVKSTALDSGSLPQMYFPYSQFPVQEMFLVLRSSTQEPSLLAEAVRETILRLDPDQPVAMVRTMEEWLSLSLSRQRFAALLLTAFALLGLALATLGIYAVMSSFVTERTHEMGIRLAIGAQLPEVLWLFYRQSLSLSAAGVAVGLAGSFLLMPFMTNQLHRLSPLDPEVYLLAIGVLLTVTLLATYVSARKVIRLDPLHSLRHF